MLCDHYTGTLPSQWLRESSFWVDACLERIPGFKAEAKLSAYNVEVLSSGRVDARRATNDWEQKSRELHQSSAPREILPMAEMAARVNLVGGHAEVIGDACS